MNSQRISFLSLVKNCNHKGLGIYYLLKKQENEFWKIVIHKLFGQKDRRKVLKKQLIKK
jgi:hypothetical protein